MILFTRSEVVVLQTDLKFDAFMEISPSTYEVFVTP